MFRSSHFLFLFTFGDEVTKILSNLCLHFARQDGQDGKKQKENHATKVTKIPKIKRRKYGMNETEIRQMPYLNALLTKKDLCSRITPQNLAGLTCNQSGYSCRVFLSGSFIHIIVFHIMQNRCTYCPFKFDLSSIKLPKGFLETLS